MFTHPELLLLQATERRLELEEEARRTRLLTSRRWTRRARRLAAAQADAGRASARSRGRPAGTLAAWPACGAQAR